MDLGTIGMMIFGAGAVGGLLNGLMTDGGFKAPRKVELSTGEVLWCPGCIGNTIIGGVAAIVLWGLYGPLSDYSVSGATAQASPDLPLAGLVGALVSGIGGGKVITTEIDKRLLNSAKQDLSRAVEAMAKAGIPSGTTGG
jgi:hypothetical protein